ncbi:MAG TPA: hypothetical protein VFS43_04075 [Polyangiaceae bacterium]|nr:hypothetical protein [Polyangiaceae bacterium]
MDVARSLEDEWFSRHSATAFQKTNALGYATMEVRFGLRGTPRRFDHHSLLEAARGATVRTTGWPFGFFSDNDNKPKPQKDGIVAQVEANFMGCSLDYWAIRTTGDFYLLRTLFEDKHDPVGKFLYYNARIWQTAEALLYCKSLYTRLGLDAGTVDFRLAHHGTKGRRIAHSNPEQRIYSSIPPNLSHDDASETDVSFEHPITAENIARTVQAMLDPLFVTFDFFKPGEEMYREIVEAFLQGRCL